MKSDQNQGPEAFLGTLLELMPLGEDQLREFMVGYLGTAELPDGEFRGEVDGAWATLAVIGDQAVVSADVGGTTVLFEVSRLEARAMVSAAAVVERTRGFVADTYQQMLAELDYQVACYRQGRTPQRPDRRAVDVTELRGGDDRVIGVDVADPDAEPVVMLRGQDGALRFPDARLVSTADVARLLGFDDQQTARLRMIAENADDCPHTAMPPANSVAPFERRLCPMCGQRMQAYPGSTNDTGEPEWAAIP